MHFGLRLFWYVFRLYLLLLLYISHYDPCAFSLFRYISWIPRFGMPYSLLYLVVFMGHSVALVRLANLFFIDLFWIYSFCCLYIISMLWTDFGGKSKVAGMYFFMLKVLILLLLSSVPLLLRMLGSSSSSNNIVTVFFPKCFYFKLYLSTVLNCCKSNLSFLPTALSKWSWLSLVFELLCLDAVHLRASWSGLYIYSQNCI